MLPQLTHLKRVALDLLFPQYCVGCGKEAGFFCEACLHSLRRISPPVCPRCGRPHFNIGLCHDCADVEFELDGIRSPFIFDGAIRQAVYQLKYHNLRAIAAPMAGLLRDYLAAENIPAEVLVPVPLHPARLRERGYNQSGLLSNELGKLTGLPVISDCLIRMRNTSAQVKTTDVRERHRNMAGAFACKNDRMKEKKALLIDDVATSGATLDACAAALKAGGATSVWCLVMAREI